MPDPLGAAAAASQFVAQALSITIYFYQSFSKIKDAPEAVRKGLAQVEQLISLSRLVIQNSALQTDSIASILATCLRNATMLESILKRLSPSTDAGRLEKLRKAIVAVFKEDEVTKLFASLDREKMSLSLAIHEINSSLLHGIGIQFQAVQTNLGDLLLVANDSARNLQTTVNVLLGVSEQVTTIHETVPTLSDKVTAMHDDVISTLISLLKINYEKILEAINGCSIKAQGYYNVPSRHTRHFMGRQEVLNKLKELPSELSPGRIVLRGLGGQGKSQIALEYCRQTRYSPFKTTFWIDATSDNTIKRDFDLFYQRFRNQSDDRLESVNTIIDFVRDSFERMTEPWLLVFDNYDNPKTANIRDYIPTSNLGSILVTTRSNEVMELASPGFAVEVEALEGEDAAKLLLACAGLEQNIDSEEMIAKDIVGSLSNHALAIAQAGAYLRKLKLPLAEFLDHYQENQRRILEQDLPMTEYQRKLDTSEKATSLNVFTTWELSFQQLLGGNDSNKLKEDLLTLLGFSYSQHMSEEMFKIFCTNMESWDTISAMKKLPGAFLADRLGDWDSLTFGLILAELYDLCLIQSYDYGDDGFYHVSLHPLVKDWIKLRTEKEVSWEYQILSTEILIEAMNPSKAQPSNIALSYISPYLRAEILGVHSDDKDGTVMAPTDANAATRLLGLEESLAMLMADAGNYRESEKLHFRISRAVERNFGTNDLQTVKAKFQLANSKWHMGKYRESEALLRSLQETSIALQGLQGSLTMEIRSCLSQSLLQLDQLTEARAIQGDLLDLAKKSDGLVPRTANRMGGLAKILVQQNCFEEAEILLEFALTIPDLEWVDTYSLNGTLGGLYHRMANWKKAEAHYSEALSALLLEVGQDHPSTLIMYGNLACCQAELGRFENSMELYKTVTDGLKKVLGIEHPQTILLLKNLVKALLQSISPDDAEARFRGLVDPQNSEQDLFFADIMGRIARQLQHEGNFLDFAKTVASWSLSTWSKIAGPSDPRVLSAEELVHSLE